MERQTVEYTFEGEKVSFLPDEHGDLTLYRTDEEPTYVHLDARKDGDNAVLETGHHPRGFSERSIRVMWPELWEAQGRK
jgi:hypothetical protein